MLMIGHLISPINRASEFIAQCAPLHVNPAQRYFRSASFSPEKVIRVTPNRQHAFERLVLQVRAEMFRPLVLGIDLDDKQGSMELLADELSIVLLIELHNCGQRKSDLHEPICCGSQYSKDVSLCC
jgi:hypothetical protein